MKSTTHFVVPKGKLLTFLQKLFDEANERERLAACAFIKKIKKTLQKPVNK